MTRLHCPWFSVERINSYELILYNEHESNRYLRQKFLRQKINSSQIKVFHFQWTPSLIEFMLIWLKMTLFRFFVLNFFMVSLKLSSTDRQVIKSDPLTFLARPWEISLSLKIAVVFERSNVTSEKRFKESAGSGIKLLMSEHHFKLQNFLIKFAKFLANWVVPEKFKYNPLLTIKRSAIFLLSSLLTCKRLFVNCLTVKFVLVCQLFYRQVSLSFI